MSPSCSPAKAWSSVHIYLTLLLYLLLYLCLHPSVHSHSLSHARLVSRTTQPDAGTNAPAMPSLMCPQVIDSLQASIPQVQHCCTPARAGQVYLAAGRCHWAHRALWLRAACGARDQVKRRVDVVFSFLHSLALAPLRGMSRCPRGMSRCPQVGGNPEGCGAGQSHRHALLQSNCRVKRSSK